MSVENLPYLTLHGSALALTEGDRLMGQGRRGAGLKGYVTGLAPGSEYIRLPDLQAGQELLEDFLGVTMSTRFASHKGSDGGCVDFAISAAINGMVRGTMGAGAGATMAVNGIQLDSQLNWKAANGGLVMEAAVKISAITTVALFVGFTDQVSALEMPATLAAGDALTTNFSDGCGFLFDTAADTDHYFLVGVKGDTDATKQSLGTGYDPLTSAFQRLRVEVGADEVARFYINGSQVGSQMSAALTKTVALTPVVVGFSRAASSRNVDVDYLYCHQNVSR